MCVGEYSHFPLSLFLSHPIRWADAKLTRECLCVRIAAADGIYIGTNKRILRSGGSKQEYN